MTKTWGFLFLLLLILAACTAPTDQSSLPGTSTAAQPASTTLPSTPSQTIQSFTRTPLPSRTPAPPPSLTPTFDIASVVTRTPALPEKCPAPANVPLPDLSIEKDDFSLLFSPREAKVLDYLNQGGNPSSLITALRQSVWKHQEIYTDNEAIKDLTGDGIPELLIIPSELYIFGCQNNKYKVLMTKISESVSINFITLQIVAIQDMNLNGVPEIVLANFGCGGMSSGQCLDVYIYEWNGNEFASLIPKWEGYEVGVSIYGSGDEWLPGAKLQDIDHNGTLELTLSGGIPSAWYDDYFSHAPWRIQSDTYHWNGQHFVPLKTEFSPPEYRYQAVQDGDRAMLRQEYDKALTFYQEAIFNDKLLGWSPAHKERSKALHGFTWDFDESHGTPTPMIPPDDPQEYPNLAAYARFRIMVLHILKGHLPEAQTVYETLQEKFPEGKDGHEFTLIAQAFWDEHQLSKGIEGSCTQAISVAEKHKDILKFLGSEHHNSIQDIMYESKDVCPFK